MNFHVGQKVICVSEGSGQARTKGCWNYRWPAAIKRGGIYTIRDIEDMIASHGVLGLRFFEYVHPPRSDGWETGFASDNFRPLDERKTDISVFTEILKNTKAPVPAV